MALTAASDLRGGRYVLIVALKCLLLGGMVMLHAKIKFKLNFGKEQQQQLFADVQPSARPGAQPAASAASAAAYDA